VSLEAIRKLFVADYEVPLKPEDMECIGMDDPKSGQVLVVVNRVGDLPTGNFRDHLVVNAVNHNALQLVMNDKRFDTRQSLARIPARQIKGKTG